MGKEKELFLEEGKEARWELFGGGGDDAPVVTEVDNGDDVLRLGQPGETELSAVLSPKTVFWRSQAGPNLVVVGKNKIKTFPPFPCPLLSYYLRALENQGIL